MHNKYRFLIDLTMLVPLLVAVSLSSAHAADNDVRAPGSALAEWFHNGQSVKLVEENIRGGVSKPEHIVVTEGPAGQAYQFTDYYYWLPMRKNPPGLGQAWTVSMWVRVDDGDWGAFQLPWNSDPSVSRKYAAVHQVLASVQDPFKPFWQLRVVNQRLELMLNNAWSVIGTTRFTPGRWTHVAAVRDQDRVRLYVDGKRERLAPAPQFDPQTGKLGSPPPGAAAAEGRIPATAMKAPTPYALLVLGNQHDSAAPFAEQFVGAIGGFSLVDRATAEAELDRVSTEGRKAADALSIRYSVLSDPAGGLPARPDKRDETPKQYLSRMAWWHRGKYGLFMHWNPSSVGGMEISWGRQDNPERCDNLHKQFNPTLFDPARWAADARRGGFRYMVWTAKHHDGFTMWPSKTTDYNITATPYGKDIVAQYVQALRGAKMSVGIYFSPRDWLWERLHGSAEKDPAKRAQLVQYIRTQLEELCANYGPLDVLWFDGGIGGESAMYRDIIGKHQANSITNDRNGPGDHLTPEGRIPSRPCIAHDGSDALWETCTGMGNGGWSYHFDGVSDYDGLIREMIEIFAKGGNLLRNIGPRPTGEWSPQARERILQIGDWLARNGASVYGTHRTRLGRLPFGWATANETTLFLHVLSWPKDGAIRVEGLFDEVERAALLDGEKQLQFRQNADVLIVELPATAPDPVDTVRGSPYSFWDIPSRATAVELAHRDTAVAFLGEVVALDVAPRRRDRRRGRRYLGRFPAECRKGLDNPVTADTITVTCQQVGVLHEVYLAVQRGSELPSMSFPRFASSRYAGPLSGRTSRPTTEHHRNPVPDRLRGETGAYATPQRILAAVR
jgi:alpha-L-fucosidase